MTYYVILIYEKWKAFIYVGWLCKNKYTLYNMYEPRKKFFEKLLAYLAILHGLPWKGCFHWQSQEWENLTRYNIKHIMQKSSPTPEKLSSQEWKFWLSGVATLITGLFGLLGNGVSLVVLCRRWFYLKKLDHGVFILPMEMKVELCNCIYLWRTGIRMTVMRKRIVIPLLLGFRVPL